MDPNLDPGQRTVLVHQRLDTGIGDADWVQSTTAPSATSDAVQLKMAARRNILRIVCPLNLNEPVELTAPMLKNPDTICMALNSSDNTLTVISPQEMPLTENPPTAEKHTYGQILKSSALIGGSSVINIAIGIVRTKAMAMLLGPAGFGLMGMYTSIANLAQSIAGMGINSSGVRQIAEAVGSGETERIARTAVVLRRTSVFLGILGAVLLVAFSKQVSILTFGDNQHAIAVALLSLAVFFTLVSAGQGALIQGMRRIADLARMGVLGTFFGLVISIPLVYFLREKGVVPALIGVAAMTIITSWWYSRKIQITPPVMTASQVRQEAASLLKLGFAFMASGFLHWGAAYAVRTMVLPYGRT
jgi:O-antigen/teichoic acid export membrane protein